VVVADGCGESVTDGGNNAIGSICTSYDGSGYGAKWERSNRLL
jgi:hypothetical protein